ncbi:MAG: DUF2147 domain-containing protein [Aquabacterium sp.]
MRARLMARCGGFAACCALMSPALLEAAPPDAPAMSGIAGDWLAPAEDADDVDALITLSSQDGVWRGVIKAIKQTRADQKLLDGTPCAPCTGARHNQPLKGMEVIWGLREADGLLRSGQVLDPGDGTIYDCEIQRSPDGRTLKVTAYKGLKLLGHTMTWTRP